MKRNPLSIAFGSVLKELREDHSVSVSDLADAIGINESYYRVVENGSTTVHVSKAIDFFNGFKSSNIEVDYLGIRDVLLGISYVNNYFVKVDNGYQVNHAYKNGVLDHLKALEPKLGLLLEKLERTDAFDLLDKSNQEIVSIFTSERFMLFLSRFLTNYEDVGESIEAIGDHFTQQFFDDLPTYYFEFLDSMKKQLLDMPISINLQEIAKWEQRNGEKFKKLDILVKNHDFVSSEKNLKNYTYDYLFSDPFEELNIIYLDSNEEEGNVENSFNENIQRARKEKSYTSLVPPEGKIKFFSTPKNLLRGAESRLILNDTSYNVTWVFTFHNGLRIGFMATIIDNGDRLEYSQGLSLNYKETIDRLSFMTKIMAWGERS